MKSAILPASRYKDDWLSHRNLKNHSSGVNYNTRAFAKSQGLLIPTIARKNRGPHNLLHLTVFCYFFVFFTNHADGALKFNKFSEICENSGLKRFVAFYDFSSLLCCSQSAGLGFRFRLIPRKVRKIVPHFIIFFIHLHHFAERPM